MSRGRIIKGIGGFYYVRLGDVTVECKARGKFRNEKISPLIGDIVDIVEKNNSYVIDYIAPRKNVLIRPPVANVDQAIIVFAATKPEPNLYLLDRFLVLSEFNCLDVIICINKADLLELTVIRSLLIPYEAAGYRVIYTSTLTKYGIDELKQCLKDRTTVFAGPSGVGKSSLINAMQPGLSLKTGILSDKIERGKHTTRHSELMELEGDGYVVDTPGFSVLDINFLNKEKIQQLFPEFDEYIGRCKYTGCLHINEPDCAIKTAAFNNKISNERYNSYVRMYTDISKLRRSYK